MNQNCAFLLFVLITAQCYGQSPKEKTEQAVNLRLNKLVSSDINPQKTDIYRVRLNKGQFAAIRIFQESVGVAVLVDDPLDSLQQIVDENGVGHDEVVAINAAMTGNYTIKVMWSFSKPLSGRYQLTLNTVEEIGKTTALKARQLMNSWYQPSSPGAAVAVVKNGQVVFMQSRGMANLSENISLANSSVFEMASCAKQFTAFAIAMLIDRGMISLSDDIRKYLPGMPDYGEKITVAHLVYHTSGIRNFDALELTGVSPEDNITLDMAYKFAVAQKQLKFKPGERFDYSNTNYSLLAKIVEKVTGKSFSGWTKETIFLPLEMKSTFFKEQPGQVYPGKVLCYKREGTVFVERPNNYAAMGSAALCSTLDDLVKWVNSFRTKQLITPVMDSVLMTTARLNDGSSTSYAFGNYIGTYGGISIEHLGLVIGYRTAIGRYPEKGVSVIYLSNDNDDGTYQHFYRIRDLFLGIPEMKPNMPVLPDVDKVIAELEKNEVVDYSEFEGQYFSSELSTALTLKVINGKLYVTHPRMKNHIELLRNHGDSFNLITIHRNAKNQVISFTMNSEQILFVKQ